MMDITSQAKVKTQGLKRRRAYLSDVQVVTLRVQLGVVRVEESRIDTISRGNGFTAFASSDNMGVLAVCACRTQAEGVTDLEVAASLVDLAVVDNSELVALECYVRDANGGIGC